MFLTRLFLAVWCVICAASASAHEFWIDPERYQIAPGENIVARFRNGEAFEGVALSYFDRNSKRLEVIMDGSPTTLTPRLGDNPAIDIPATCCGLAVLAHETTPSFVTYKSYEKFQKFADHKDFPNWRADHEARGYPAPPFKERYTRHAKALVTIGDGAGADRRIGLRTEFVALSNPYVPGFDGTMRVALYDGDSPRPDAQVEVFARAPDGSVAITLHRTDASGIAAIPVTPGHAYLFDAVILKPIPAGEDAVWDTFWAALTFAVP